MLDDLLKLARAGERAMSKAKGKDVRLVEAVQTKIPSFGGRGRQVLALLAEFAHRVLDVLDGDGEPKPIVLPK